MRRKKEFRKLAKTHVHHKYSANMLSIMHSQRDQKVLITRMKNRPEQNTNEGGSSASVSERCWPSCSGEQQMLSTACCWAFSEQGFLSWFFSGLQKINRFWIHITDLHKDTHRNSLSQSPDSAVFRNNVRASHTHPISGRHYCQARINGEFLLQIIVFRGPWQ